VELVTGGAPAVNRITLFVVVDGRLAAAMAA